MPVEVRGSRDEILDAIVSVLESYQVDHPEARITTYRYSPYSVRVRIVDPAFAKMKRFQQNDLVWDYLDRLSEDEQGDINQCLLLTPDEVENSPGNLEFEHPTPPLSLKGAAAE
jgi:hypothetical protein